MTKFDEYFAQFSILTFCSKCPSTQYQTESLQYVVESILNYPFISCLCISDHMASLVFLQFTTDQNLLIKKDIFRAAHFPMTCQPFWASCHLPSQHCGWGLIPSKLCELRASEREGERQREREGETQVCLVHLETYRLSLRYMKGPCSVTEEFISFSLSSICSKLLLSTIRYCNMYITNSDYCRPSFFISHKGQNTWVQYLLAKSVTNT